MKKINLFLVLLILMSVFAMKARSGNGKPKKNLYSIEYKFTGTIENQLDSVFIAYCVFEKRQLKDFNKLILKTGSSDNLLSEEFIDLSDKSRIDKKFFKYYVKVGKAGPDLSFIEIEAKDDFGNKTKFKVKPKY